MLLELNFTLILFAVSFLIFMCLLNLTLYKPVGEVIEKRKNLIESDYAQAKATSRETEEILTEYKDKIKKTKQETQNSVHNATSQALKLKEEKLQQLMDKLNKGKEESLKVLEQEKKAALTKLEADIKILTNLIVNKVLGVEDKGKTLVGSK